MANRVYTDLNKLRSETNDLIDRGRVRIHKHARESHPELSELEQVGVVRYGGPIKSDRDRGTASGVYVCWAHMPKHGLCRGVFCIEEGLGGDLVVIITAFKQS